MRTVLLTLIFAIFPLSASAHGGTPSLEKEVGEYLIDIGYNQVGLRPREEVSFDFDLLTAEGAPSFVPFEFVRVEVRRGEEIVVSHQIENKKNFVPNIKVIFPEAGTYQLEAAYVQSGSIIADTSFDLTVEENNGQFGRLLQIATYVTAALLTMFAAYVVIRSFAQRR